MKQQALRGSMERSLHQLMFLSLKAKILTVPNHLETPPTQSKDRRHVEWSADHGMRFESVGAEISSLARSDATRFAASHIFWDTTHFKPWARQSGPVGAQVLAAYSFNSV